ncbi:hypothetical protein TNCV_4761711 [Trichonephila clavipes]|nr:hypothetical protein TNCV_4761711 [Trichonephila clavipes]
MTASSSSLIPTPLPHADTLGERRPYKKNPEGPKLANLIANDAKMATKVAKLVANLVVKKANLALSPRFRQVLIESPL